MAEYIEREALIDVLAVSHAHHANSNREAALLDRDIRLVREQPAADVVEVVPELRKVVELLRKECEKAKQNPVVHDPLAYALYQTWKAVDGRKNGR